MPFHLLVTHCGSIIMFLQYGQMDEESIVGANSGLSCMFSRSADQIWLSTSQKTVQRAAYRQHYPIPSKVINVFLLG